MVLVHFQCQDVLLIRERQGMCVLAASMRWRMLLNNISSFSFSIYLRDGSILIEILLQPISQPKTKKQPYIYPAAKGTQKLVIFKFIENKIC